MTTLQSIKEGHRAKIVKIEAGKGMGLKLSHMGLFRGDIVRVVRKTRGPVIIGKGELRLALGRGLSSRIYVEGLPEEKL